MRKHLTLSPAFIICALLLSSCKNLDNVVWAHFTGISPDGWETLPPVTFEPDSTVFAGGPCDVLLSVRYYPHRCAGSITLCCEQESLDDSCSTSEVTLRLLDDGGKATGRGNYGIYEITDTVIHARKLPAGWVMSVTPRQKSEGITDVGLTIVKSYR